MSVSGGEAAGGSSFIGTSKGTDMHDRSRLAAAAALTVAAALSGATGAAAEPVVTGSGSQAAAGVRPAESGAALIGQPPAWSVGSRQVALAADESDQPGESSPDTVLWWTAGGLVVGLIGSLVWWWSRKGRRRRSR